jgi:hypothetical protein
MIMIQDIKEQYSEILKTRHLRADEFNTFVKDLISAKWLEQFPKDFIHGNTTNKKEYMNTSGIASRCYAVCLNHASNVYFNNPKYKVTDYSHLVNDKQGLDGEEIQRKEQLNYLNDLADTNNIKVWVIDNIGFQ